MADNQGNVELLLDVRRALTALSQFEAKYGATMDHAAAETRETADVVGGPSGLGEALLKVQGVIVALGASLAVVKLKEFFAGALDEAGSAQAALVEVERLVKSTGGAAHLSAAELQGLAKELAAISVYDDDEILAETTATLLRFGSLSGETFKRAQTDALNLAATLKIDLAAAAELLGKALLTPGEALRGLKTAGVDFTEAETKALEAMVAHGKVAEAQAIILERVEKATNGAAAAARDTLGGAIKALNRDWGELQQSFGEGFAGEFQQGIDDASGGLQELQGSAKGAGQAVGAVVSAFLPLLPILTKLAAPVVALFGNMTRGAAAATKSIVDLAEGVARAVASMAGLASKLPAKFGGDLFAGIAEGAKQAVVDIEEFGERTARALEGAADQMNTAANALWAGPDSVGASAGKAAGALDEVRKKGDAALDPIPDKAKKAGEALARDLSAGADKAKLSLEQMADAARRSVEGSGAFFAGKRPSDVAGLQEQKAGLEETVKALKNKEEQSGLTLEESNRLAEADSELHDVQRDLNVATLDVNRAMASEQQLLESLSDTAKPTAAQLAQLANDLEAAGHNFGDLEVHLADVDPEFQKHNENVKEAVSNTEALNKSLKGTGIEFKEAGNAITEQTAAVKGLADRQADGLGPMGDYGKAAGEAAAETKKAAKETKTFEERLSDLEKVVESAFGKGSQANVKALADAIRRDLIPACQELNKCLDETGVG